MRDTNLVNALSEHAEWAEGNQWETPITLCDDLAEAADLIEDLASDRKALINELYSDFEKQAKFAVAPIVEPNSEFVVAVHDGKRRELYAVLIVETKGVNKFCSTPLGVEDVDMSHYVTLANARYGAWKEE